MDRMLEGLENLLDDVGDPTYEVEYGVRSGWVVYCAQCLTTISARHRAVS